MPRRRLLLVLGVLAVALAGAGAWYRAALPPFGGQFHAVSDVEAATIAPALERAAERNVLILGGPARTNFCALHIYGTDHALAPGKPSSVYTWASCATIHPRRDPTELAFSSGSWFQVRFDVRGAGRNLKVIELEVPGDGAANGPDTRRLFPRKVVRQIFSHDSGLTGDPDPDCTNLHAAQRRFGLPGAPGVDAFDPKTLQHCPRG